MKSVSRVTRACLTEIDEGWGGETEVELKEPLVCKRKTLRARNVTFCWIRECKIEATNCIIQGSYNVITGSNNIIVGNNNYVSSSNSLIFGDSNSIFRDAHYSIINGNGTVLAIESKTLVIGHDTRRRVMSYPRDSCEVEADPWIWNDVLNSTPDNSLLFNDIYDDAYAKASILLVDCNMPLEHNSVIYPGFRMILSKLAAFTFPISDHPKTVKATWNSIEICFLGDFLLIKDGVRVELNGTKISKKLLRLPRRGPLSITDLKILLNRPSPTVVDKPLIDHSADKMDDADTGTNDECSICLDNQIDTALVPCGHMAFCYNCACSLIEKSCPICRVVFDRALKIYKS